MIKAMFFDLDNTLLDSKKNVPRSAVLALNKCRNKGIKLFIATARTPQLFEVLGWSKDIAALFSGGIYCNGAVNILDGVAEYNFIESKVVNGIVESMNKFPNIVTALQLKDNVHAFNNILSESELLVWGVGKDNIFSTENVNYEEILKLLIFEGEFTTELKVIPKQVVNIVSDLCGKHATFYVTDNGKVIQIVSIKASKYKGIESIRNQFGIEKDEVAVFGDDLNDLEMIKEYENSVAMGNAVEEIKSAAKYITKSNDNDGIAFAINNFIEM